jgi:hypothetical protein
MIAGDVSRNWQYDDMNKITVTISLFTSLRMIRRAANLLVRAYVGFSPA